MYEFDDYTHNDQFEVLYSGTLDPKSNFKILYNITYLRRIEEQIFLQYIFYKYHYYSNQDIIIFK